MSIKLIYKIPTSLRAKEMEWLRQQMIFPSMADWYDFSEGKSWLRVGVIVSPSQALAVKLRHPLEFQTEYKQR